LAMALLSEAARDLAALIEALLRTGAQRLCLMGGLAAALEHWLPPPHRAHLVPAEGDALAGALLMARRTVPNDGATG
ncbi:MAG TPA: N-acetylglucosamine kinase, partial [Alphaproteobacteria bacterium]|nr:N-acetylglucosamine kinase [Alphaproteobacteria bacterium]